MTRIARLVNLVSFALALGACMTASQRPVHLDYRSAPGAAAEGAVVDGSHVRVLVLTEPLPDGITWGEGAKPIDKLHLEPGYPTPEAPHHVVGAVAASGDDGRDALTTAARAEAGRHGANAVLLLEAGQTTVTALALWVSPAAPNEHFPAAAELLREPPPELAGYTPRAQPIALSLAAPAPIELVLHRGDCLAVHLALESDATLRPLGAALMLNRKNPDGMIDSSTFARGVTHRTRSIGNPAGCALVNGRITLSFTSRHPLGDGQALVQLYERHASEDELAQLAARNQALEAEAIERSRADDRRDCQACLPLLVRCGTPERPASCQEYKSCLSRKYVTVERCQR